MVVEHNYVLSLDEIKAVRFRCRKCHASTSFRLNETISFPVTCPGCKARLYDNTLDTGDTGLVESLPRVIKSLIELQKKEKAGFEMLLEMDVR